MAGPSLQHQESHVFMRDFRGCRSAFLQWFDFHRRIRIIPGGRSRDLDFPLLSQHGDATDMDSDSSTTSKHRSRKKSSKKSKALFKSFIPKKFYRKQDQKQKILPLSPQLLRTISIHHLELKKYEQSDASTSSSSSSSARGSFHGDIDIMAMSSSRNENDSLVPRHLNVIQEKSINRSSSTLSKMHSDLKSTSTRSLDTTRNAGSNQNGPQINKNLKQVITMDGVLHKIPYGQKQPEHSKFSTRLSLFRSVSVNYDRGHSHQVMKRSRSLSDSVGRYSQLLEAVSRESTLKTTESGTRVAADQSFNQNTVANNTSQGEGSSSSTSESMQSGTELTKDNLLEKQEIVHSLQVIESISSPSETVVDDIRLTEEDSFRQSMEATHALSNVVESISCPFVQYGAKGVCSGSQILESSEECEDLILVKEKEEFSAMQDEASPRISNYEMLQESSVSVLDSDIFDDCIPAEIKNFEDSNDGLNLTNIPGNFEFGDSAPPLVNYDNLPSQLVQGNEADLNNLKELFENYGFSDDDFVEITNFLLQEVCQENDKIPFGYDFTKIDYDFGGFYYDENMSLDQNILYSLTHEALRENLKKYRSSGTLVPSYTIVPKPDPLQNVLMKDLRRNLNCYVNSEVCVSAILASGSLQNDGWLNYQTEKERLGVELGDEIFYSMIDELLRGLLVC